MTIMAKYCRSISIVKTDSNYDLLCDCNYKEFIMRLIEYC